MNQEAEQGVPPYSAQGALSGERWRSKRKMNAAGQSHTKVQRQHGFGNEREMEQPNEFFEQGVAPYGAQGAPPVNADVQRSEISKITVK